MYILIDKQSSPFWSITQYLNVKCSATVLQINAKYFEYNLNIRANFFWMMCEIEVGFG